MNTNRHIAVTKTLGTKIMKRVVLTFFVFFIAFHLKSSDHGVILKYTAKQLYYNKFHELTELNISKSEFFTRNFDNVSGWDGFQFMVFGYPVDTIGKNYNQKREKYINEFLERTKFYIFPIMIDSVKLDCFLLSCTDTINVHYYRFLRLYCYNPKDSTQEPTLLLNYRELHDGLSRTYENSEFTIFSNNQCVSKFVYTYESLDLLPIDNEPWIPDTMVVTVKMTYSGMKGLIVESEDNSWDKIK